jgi:single-stranded DNA-binding protein
MTAGGSFARAYVVGKVTMVFGERGASGARIRLSIERRYKSRSGEWESTRDTCVVEMPDRYSDAARSRLPRGTLLYVEGRVVEREDGPRVACESLRVILRAEREAGAKKVRRHEHDWGRDTF